MRALIALAVLTLFVPAASLAAPKKVYEKFLINKAETEVVLLKETFPEELIFYAVVKGNVSETLNLEVSGPKNIDLLVEQKVLGKEDPAEAVRKKKGFAELPVFTREEMTARHGSCLNISYGEDEEEPEVNIADYPPVWTKLCEETGREYLEETARLYSLIYGGAWTAEHVCSYIMANTPESEYGYDDFLDYINYINSLKDTLETGESEGEGETGTELARLRLFSKSYRRYGVLSLDACSKRKTKYLVKVTLDLRGVNLEELADETTIGIELETQKYTGGMQSAIKPESEGRYSPRPIVMMNYMGSVCGNRIEAVRWSNGRIVSRSPLEIYSLLSYTDYVLNLALVDSVIPGPGSATFEYTDGSRTYGVCFKLKRSRQEKNGY